jgi:ATP-dependent exoDNAse (exonuclease V) beta subunit
MKIEGAVADLAARERALDPRASFIVQAPAGSGKTELLIQRVLVLLAVAQKPEEIAAITFTRKAAAEMRKRIFAALDSARHEPRPASAHKAKTWDLGRAVVERSDALHWALEENTSRLRVQTIDALCASLTRQMPVLAKFGAQPQSVDDARLLYLEAARETLALVEDRDDVAADVASVLAHLDNNVERAERLIAGLLGRRDHWLRSLQGADDRAALEAVLADICRIATARARDLFPAGDGKYALPPLDDMPAWRAVADTYVTKDGAWRKKGVPAELSANGQLREALCALRSVPNAHYDEAQWRVLGAILRLARIAVGQLKRVFAAHGEADFTEIAQGALRALETDAGPTDLLLALDYSIRHILVDEFQDTSFTQYELLRMLTSGWTPDDGRTLFLVGDPMQSIYRFREAEVGLFLRARREGIGGVALEPLTLSANFRSQAGIVGWVNETFGRVMPEVEDIALGAVPYSASDAVQAEIAGAVTVHPFFNGDLAGEARAVAEIARAALASPGLDPDKPSTAAILVRNRKHLEEIVPRLRASGIPFRAIEIEPLGERPVVLDLVALTRALVHLGDRTAWLAVLRAPWCGLSLDDLARLAEVEPPAPPVPGEAPRRHELETVWEAMHPSARVAALSPQGGRRLARVRDAFAHALAQRRRGLLRDAVEGLWLAIGGPACAEDAGGLEDAYAYLDHLEEAERGGALPDMTIFENSLRELYASPGPDAGERLQVMTIHKAKGLEFDTVIVPGLGAGARGEERKLFVWMERPIARGGGEAIEFQFLLSPIGATGADPDATYEYIRALDKEKDAIQDARLLYVASTRPRRAHHLLGDVRRDATAQPARHSAPRKEALLHPLWPVVERHFAEASAEASNAPLPPRRVARGEEIVRLAEGVADAPMPAAVQWEAPSVPRDAEDEVEFSWVGEAARHAGSVVHRWLQRIADDSMKGWSRERVMALRPAVRRALVARGLSESDVDAYATRVIDALAGSLDDPRGRWILGPHKDARTEYRISARVGGEMRRLVIDRMFTDDDGRRWIVDYKTSSHEGGGLEEFLDLQLTRYARQLGGYASAFTDGETSLGLYFPLVKGWREWKP